MPDSRAGAELELQPAAAEGPDSHRADAAGKPAIHDHSGERSLRLRDGDGPEHGRGHSFRLPAAAAGNEPWLCDLGDVGRA